MERGFQAVCREEKTIVEAKDGEENEEKREGGGG